MRHRIIALLLTDTLFAVLVYSWVCIKWDMMNNYGAAGIGLLVLLGPLFVLIKYDALFSLAIFSWPIPLCIILGYALIMHSHAKFLTKCSTKNCIAYFLYVVASWFVYAVASLFVDYFTWYYCQ